MLDIRTETGWRTVMLEENAVYFSLPLPLICAEINASVYDVFFSHKDEGSVFLVSVGIYKATR
jgi:hypothetical protein